MQLQPTVQRKDKTRRGRGFSRAELREAGTDFRQALKSCIPVDQRRKTKYENNIEILKQYLQNLGSKKKKKSKSLDKKKI
jgi:large subunit ribosomal protein L13e